MELTIQISGVEYNIDLSTGKSSIENQNSETGLGIIYELFKIEIEPQNKRIQTTWDLYDKTPTGKLINKRRETYLTSQEGYDNFEESMLGMLIKKHAVNGCFRKIIEVTDAVFDDNGDVIEPQPYTFPTEE